MKSRMIQKFQWIAAKLSIVSMVMLPVAEGQAAENYQNQISKQQMQQVFLAMGLNKTQTFGEFYAKNKSYLPLRIQKELNQFVKNNGMLGRSEGCFALDRAISKTLIDKVKDGSLWTAYN